MYWGVKRRTKERERETSAPRRKRGLKGNHRGLENKTKKKIREKRALLPHSNKAENVHSVRERAKETRSGTRTEKAMSIQNLMILG